MFSLLTLLPLYFQIVKNLSATQSGLSTGLQIAFNWFLYCQTRHLTSVACFAVPMMGSLVVIAIVCGQIVSRTGKYSKVRHGAS